MQKNFIISGGPGSGKTTLLNELSKLYNVSSEVSRQIIKEQQLSGGILMPWMDMVGFGKICYDRMMDLLQKSDDDITFFDRGIPDIVAYLRHQRLNVDERYLKCKDYYYKTVFMCPPWEDIYANDEQRPQTFEESIDIFYELMEVYKQMGFTVILLPAVSVKERADFIEKEIKKQFKYRKFIDNGYFETTIYNR